MQADDAATRIGAQVMALRERHRWTPAELARRAGVSRATLIRIEAGQQEPTAGTLERLAEALGVSVLALLGAPERDSDRERAIQRLLDELPGDPAEVRKRVEAALRALFPAP